MKKTEIRQPHRVLIIVLQRIGDVLLATPIASSLKARWPDVQIDFLVSKGTEGILSPGDGCVERVIVADRNASIFASLRLLLQIFRRYDLAVSTQSGDRSIFLTLVSAKQRVATVPAKKSRWDWKRAWSNAWVEDSLDRHVVEQNTLLMEAVGVNPVREVLLPQSSVLPTISDKNETSRPYVVVHPGARYSYKEWTEEGWFQVISGLLASGRDVILSGGPDLQERQYCEALCARKYLGTGTVVNKAGLTTWAELRLCLSQAILFIGVDTSVTHLAAATGIPVLGIYGPTHPVKWAPWPKGYAQASSPFKAYAENVQQIGNVTLIQGDNAKGCVPCQLEGCDRHVQSRSQCLDRLDPQVVLRTALALLSDRAGS
ncbi:MAG: glycosyltransferase family 9 protein [Acidithiobacillus sp.]